MNHRAVLALYVISVLLTVFLYASDTVAFTAGALELMVTAWFGGYTARILVEARQLRDAA